LRALGYPNILTATHAELEPTPRKLMDVSRLRALGWQASMGLEDGLRDAYAWFCAHAPTR
jgi:GDP-L-fucose synthase